MFKTNLVDVIKTFDKAEFGRMQDFVNSPFHNTNRSVSRLFAELKKFYPEFNSRNFTKEKVFAKIYGNGKYNDQVMRNLLSESLKLAYSFLEVSSFSSESFEKDIRLIHQLGTRKLYKLYEKKLKQTEVKLASDNHITTDYFQNMLKLHTEIGSHTLRINEQEKIFPVLVKQSEYNVYSFILRLLQNLKDIDLNERFLNVRYDDSPAREIIKNLDVEKLFSKLKSSNEDEYNIFRIFYYQWCMVIENNEEYYYKFKELFRKYSSKFAPQVNYYSMIALTTYCINMMHINRQGYIRELLELHKMSLELKLHKPANEPFISAIGFWNIVGCGLDAGESGWTEEFIEKYQQELSPDIRSDMYNFGMAHVEFYRKNTSKALQYLGKCRINQFMFKLLMRSLYLRIYYEAGDYESLFSAMDSYRQFLYKNKTLGEKTKQRYMNFAGILTELAKTKAGSKPADLNELRIKINSPEPIYNKAWLEEKIGELT